MMVQTLLNLIDLFLAASGMRETTLSYRMLRDSKKIADLRVGRDITTGRYEEALRWMAQNWPDGADRPSELPPAPAPELEPTPEEDAA